MDRHALVPDFVVALVQNWFWLHVWLMLAMEIAIRDDCRLLE